MSTDPVQTAGASAGAREPAGQPSEEELRAAYEAEISRITSTDMILQSVVTLLNVGGHRLGLSSSQGGATADESVRDLEQVRDAIDGVRALLPILERREPESLRPLRDALSQLQMAYAREAGAGVPAPEGAPGADQAPPTGAQSSAGAQPSAPPAGEKPAGPGPAQSSGRLWVPGR